MPLEVERKFLLVERPEWLWRCPAIEIGQGYLAITDDVEVRVRRADQEHYLTAKQGHGRVRREVEIELSREEFEQLWPLTESRRVVKTRRLVEIDGVTAEVDEFAGELEGLIVGEIEFGSESESDAFEPPAWLGREITGDQRFEGQRLATDGRPDRARA